MQITQNFLQHSRSLIQRGIVPKPNYAKALRFQIRCSPRIAQHLFRMLPAIQFHYQLSFKTDEIDNVRRNRMLSAKLESVEVAIS